MDEFLLLINWRSPARPLHSTTRRPFRKKKKRFQRPMNGLLLFEFVSYSTTNDAACPYPCPITHLHHMVLLSFFLSFLHYSPSRPLPFRLKTWRKEKQRKAKGISRRAPPCDGEQLAAQRLSRGTTNDQDSTVPPCCIGAGFFERAELVFLEARRKEKEKDRMIRNILCPPPPQFLPLLLSPPQGGR